MAIRLLIVDDQIFVRQGLKMYLQLNPDLEIIGEAENGLQALSIARTRQPDVILMDLLMPVMDGIVATRALRAEMPDLRIIALTSSASDAYLSEAILAGVDCFLPKTISPEQLVDTIYAMSRGEILLSDTILKHVLPALPQLARRPALTIEEHLLLTLIAQSYPLALIQQRLFLDDGAYRQILAQLQEKFAMPSTLLAVLVVLRNGLLDNGAASSQRHSV